MSNSSFAHLVHGSDHNNTVDDDIVENDIRFNQHIPKRLSSDSEQTTSYSTVTIDSNAHPLFIHNNDHPGLLLIAKKQVGPDNYAPWSRSMLIALNARNKFTYQQCVS